MEKRALDRRLDQMRAEGVEFVTGCTWASMWTPSGSARTTTPSS
jgi:NADPH-dependent glutamate synthase beta subunit-like oxidoreductase